VAEDSRSRGGDLFIVDNSDSEWKVRQYLHDWCDIAHSFDIASAYFEIGALIALDGEWQKLDHVRILMGDDVAARTRRVILDGVSRTLDASIENEKKANDFLAGVPAIIKALEEGKIECRVYSKSKFHAKAYITHARSAVIGSRALVGSSNFTFPGISSNVELNVQIRTEVDQLQEWYERYWDDSQDVTPDLLRVIQRHTADFTPFEVYARSLQQYFKGHEETVTEWERTRSKIWPLLDQYQREGYQALMKIGGTYNGALLCDGVGLGKTFVGLMVIERLLEKERKRVALFVPKAANETVWEAALKKYLPEHHGGIFSNLVVLNHTDLLRGGNYESTLAKVAAMVDAVVIDEAHHFRNRGTSGIGAATKLSRYRAMFELVDGKQLFMLTATPVNNSLRDLQHMIELFSRRQQDYFKAAPLGIHSLQGHFRDLDRRLEELIVQSQIKATADPEEEITDEVEASKVLLNDSLFRELVVQRSRAYVRRSQEKQHGKAAIFPQREQPIVAPYSLKQTYGTTLDYVEKAFSKATPLFFLTAYFPLKHFIGDEKKLEEAAGGDVGALTGFKFQKNRQAQVVRLIRIQLLKRFESSARAFEGSCEALLLKLYAFAKKNATEPGEAQRLAMWENRKASVLARVRANQQARHRDDDDDDDFELVPDDVLERMDALSRGDFNVPEILAETTMDLDEIAEVLEKLQQFDPSHDDKLAQLKNLLTTDPGLAKHKVLIFSEFMDTARYLKDELTKAGVQGVDEMDSNVRGNRTDLLTRFAPYYNGSSPAELAAKKLPETRVLIATDVLSEGLNLQDATFVINYDLHWNPVRLMQRIGRVDRRMNPEIEERIKREHPDRAAIRGTVRYWNFLPPQELESLLGIYGTLARKTLKISKTMGIEGRKLLTPQDNFDALREFNEAYEGSLTSDEEMHLALQALLNEHPGLEEKLDALPNRIFSGKARGAPGQLLSAEASAVFFCYALPGLDRTIELAADSPGWAGWTEAAGRTAWYLFDLASGSVLEDAAQIFAHIQCEPETPRHTIVNKDTLTSARKKVDEHIKNSYLKQVDAPIGVAPVLKAWMELS
jgi:superfamily II DNA or RNA helicase